MTILLELFASFFLVAFVSFGGASAVIPELYRIAVTEHSWMDARTFTELFAIAQAAPGPNVLIVTLIGQHVDGWQGAFFATLGMCLPMSILIYLLIDRWESFAGKRWQKAISIGVAPLAVGLIFSGATLIAQAAQFGWGAWLLVGTTLIANLRYKLHPLWYIAIGAGLGALGLI